MLKYNKITIDHDIYIKFFSGGTVYYLTVSTDDFINTTNNETEFTELTRVFEEHFEMKVQEGSVLKYLNLLIFQSSLGFIAYHNNTITELVNEWFTTEKSRNFDTHFRAEYRYEKTN